MITVSIFINGKPILTCSGVNKGQCKDVKGCYLYVVNNGRIIHHIRGDGAVALAKKILDTIT